MTERPTEHEAAGDEPAARAAQDESRARDASAAQETGEPSDGSGGHEGVDDEIVAEFERELSEARRMADESHDRYLRAEADLQNLRRRAEQRRQDALERQRRQLLSRFLEVADDLERGLRHAEGQEGPLVEGLQATWRAMTKLLEREGVARMDAEGATFDPALHEAVAVAPVPNVEDETIVSVERGGYTVNGELLRPAQVVVARSS